MTFRENTALELKLLFELAFESFCASASCMDLPSSVYLIQMERFPPSFSPLRSRTRVEPEQTASNRR